MRENTFTMASAGMAATLEGRTSHASEPEKGISPTSALERILRDLPSLARTAGLSGFGLATLTHITLGERSFGISPGKAQVLATLRAERDSELQRLQERATALFTDAAYENRVRAEISWSDQFAATTNHADAVRQIRQAAEFLGLVVTPTGQERLLLDISRADLNESMLAMVVAGLVHTATDSTLDRVAEFLRASVDTDTLAPIFQGIVFKGSAPVKRALLDRGGYSERVAAALALLINDLEGPTRLCHC